MRSRFIKYIAVFISLSFILSCPGIFTGVKDFHAQSLEDELQRIKEEREETQKKIDEISALSAQLKEKQNR